MTAWVAAALGSCLTTLVGCGVSVPDAWADFVPKDNLTMAFGDETTGEVSKLVLNYTREKVSGDELRGQFTGLIEKKGFTNVSECVDPNGTSSALYVSDSKEVFQVIINLLGDTMYDVELQRSNGQPGVALANPETCKWTASADKFCEMGPPERCTFKSPL